MKPRKKELSGYELLMLAKKKMQEQEWHPRITPVSKRTYDALKDMIEGEK